MPDRCALQSRNQISLLRLSECLNKLLLHSSPEASAVCSAQAQSRVDKEE